MYTPTVSRPCNGGMQDIYEFPNGYSASVVRHMYSYGGKDGLFELAVVHGGSLCYDTPITSDVKGYLSAKEVQEILLQIEALPPRAEEIKVNIDPLVDPDQEEYQDWCKQGMPGLMN